MTVSRRRDVLGLAAFVVMCFGVSLLGGRATLPALAHWYPELSKPAWTPPAWVFGPVWTLLYPMVAVAGWLAWREGRSRGGTLVYLLQLTLNAAWPWIFFGERRIGWALVCVDRTRPGDPGHDPGVLACEPRCRGAAAAIPGLGRLRQRPERCRLVAQLGRSDFSGSSGVQ